jgi:hypothetical protein
MKKPIKVKKPRVYSVYMTECRGKVSMHWWPLPYDKKGRFIPSSVDCVYNQEYHSRSEALNMLRSL